MKVSELTGATLDRWVANAHGMMLYTPDWQPSRRWEQGGPLIEAEHIDVEYDPCEFVWWASVSEVTRAYSSNSLLEAAMRCYVASKFGETVEE